MRLHQISRCQFGTARGHAAGCLLFINTRKCQTFACSWLSKSGTSSIQRFRRGATSATGIANPSTAKEAVDLGLEAYKKDDVDEAVRMFFRATQLSSQKDEALAAHYNLACAYTKQREWVLAVEAVAVAVNDCGLKVTVPLQDPDLKPLRERREWIDKLPQLKGSLSSAAKVELRSEIKSPYRFPRQFLFGALAASASLGLFIIGTRLIKAIQGGEGAPDLAESVQNFAINSVAVAAFGYLVFRDVQAKERDMKVVLREEDLGRLQVEVNPQRVIPLIKFRGVARPVILCGSKSYVERAIKSAEPYMIDLRLRGVSVIPVVLTSADEQSDADKLRALKEQFQKEKKSGFGTIESSASGKDKGSSASASASEPALSIEELRRQADQPELEVVIKEKERRFRYKAYEVSEWKQWMDEQKDFSKLPSTEQNCFIQVQLDGRVRSSGLGLPPWGRFVGDLPPLDDIRTTFTDGTISDV